MGHDSRFSVLTKPKELAAPVSQPRVSEAEPTATVAAAPAARDVPNMDTSQLLDAKIAEEEEALLAAVNEAEVMNESQVASAAVCARNSGPVGKAAARRGHEYSERRRRSKVVQTIALCDRLGLKYSM